MGTLDFSSADLMATAPRRGAGTVVNAPLNWMGGWLALSLPVLEESSLVDRKALLIPRESEMHSICTHRELLRCPWDSSRTAAGPRVVASWSAVDYVLSSVPGSEKVE